MASNISGWTPDIFNETESWEYYFNETNYTDFNFDLNFTSSLIPTAIPIISPTSQPTAPTLAPTEYVEYFCEISNEFDTTTWFWVLILIIPMGLLFTCIYHKLGLPYRTNKCVKFSLVKSTFTYSGVIAMIIVNWSTGAKYDYCYNPVDGDDADFMDFGFEVGIVGFFWFISNCVSLFYFVRIYLFTLAVDIDKHVYDNEIPCCRRYVIKAATIIVSFGLGALYTPFQRKGSYENPDTGLYEPACSCVNEYIWEISNLAFWLIMSPLILKMGNYCMDEAKKKRKIGRKDDDGTLQCLVGAFCQIFAIVTIITAPVYIVLLRLASILSSIFGVIQNIIDIIDDNVDSSSNDYDNIGDALLSLVRVDFIVFWIAIIHFSMMACCAKRCFANKGGEAEGQGIDPSGIAAETQMGNIVDPASMGGPMFGNYGNNNLNNNNNWNGNDSNIGNFINNQQRHVNETELATNTVNFRGVKSESTINMQQSYMD